MFRFQHCLRSTQRLYHFWSEIPYIYTFQRMAKIINNIYSTLKYVNCDILHEFFFLYQKRLNVMFYSHTKYVVFLQWVISMVKKFVFITPFYENMFYLFWLMFLILFTRLCVLGLLMNWKSYLVFVQLIFIEKSEMTRGYFFKNKLVSFWLLNNAV